MSLISSCSDVDFKQIVQDSSSFAEIEQKLGYKSYSGSVSQKIKERIATLNLDISHFASKSKPKRTQENVFIERSTASQRTLRRYYVDGAYTEYKCSICGQLPFWNNKELTLILDHINGNNHDDRLENLRWVCPNCNQQLDTFGSKNQAYKQE